MSLLALRRATASSASTCSAKAFSRSAAFGLGRPAFASTQRLFGQPRPARHNSHPGAIHTQTARESSWLAGPSSNYAGGTGLVGPDPGCHDEDAGGSHQGKAAGDQKQRGTGDEQQSLFVAGIGRRVTGGDEQKVIDLFQGVANVLSVRMAQHYVHIDVENKQQADRVIEQHSSNPFTYDGKPLRIDRSTPPHVATWESALERTLCFKGQSGEQELRAALLEFGDKIEAIRAPKPSLAFVICRTQEDAIGLMTLAAEKMSTFSVELARSPPPSEGAWNPRSDSLYLAGYDGDRRSLRRYLHDWRENIIDVRILSKNKPRDSCDDVVVRFRSQFFAAEARLRLKGRVGFRVLFHAAPERKAAPRFTPTV